MTRPDEGTYLPETGQTCDGIMSISFRRLPTSPSYSARATLSPMSSRSSASSTALDIDDGETDQTNGVPLGELGSPRREIDRLKGITDARKLRLQLRRILAAMAQPRRLPLIAFISCPQSPPSKPRVGHDGMCVIRRGLLLSYCGRNDPI